METSPSPMIPVIPMSPSPETPVSPLAELRPVNLDFSSISFADLFHKGPQRRDIDECIDKKDFESIKEIGMEQGFGTMRDNRLRVKCYSILLGCGNLDQYYDQNETSGSDSCEEDEGHSDIELEEDDDYVDDVQLEGIEDHEIEKLLEDLPSTKPTLHTNLSSNSFSKIIHRDLERNGYSRWTQTCNTPTSAKQVDLSKIEQLTNDIFSEHEDSLHYIQGMDSVIALFYVIADGNQSVAKKMIVSYLYIFRNDLALKSGSFGDIQNLYKILRKYDSRFCRWMLSVVGGEEQVAFALEWYISWFAHSTIADLEVVLRLYDFAIATQCQQIGLYMVVAVLLEHKKAMMESVETLTDFVVFCGGGGGEIDGSTHSSVDGYNCNGNDNGNDSENEEDIHRDIEHKQKRLDFSKESVESMIVRAQKIMDSERKEEQRRKQWKSSKKEIKRTFLKIKLKSKALGVIIDDLVKKQDAKSDTKSDTKSDAKLDTKSDTKQDENVDISDKEQDGKEEVEQDGDRESNKGSFWTL